MSSADHRVQKDLKSVKLLIADDDLMTQVIMKNIFKKLGWESDIVGNGLEVLEKIKHNDLTRKIPVVVLTSSRENPDIEKCYALGAPGYVTFSIPFKGHTLCPM